MSVGFQTVVRFVRNLEGEMEKELRFIVSHTYYLVLLNLRRLEM